MRIAKAVAGTIGSALLGLVITFAAIPEWTLMNLEQHFWQTIGWFLISAAFGGAVVFIVYATYMGWKLGSKPCKAFDDLRDIDGLGGCESLADMVEPVKQLSEKDTEIAELEKRPTREFVDRLNESHAAALAAKDAEIEALHSPVETARRNIASLSGNELAMVGTLKRGPMKTSDYSEVFAHLSSLGIAEKLKNPGVFTPTWGITGAALSALGEDDDLSKAADAAAENGLRDFEKERFLSESIRQLNPQQLGAVSIMFDDGYLDYQEADSDPWGYIVDQGAEDLKELSSLNIARYMTLGNGSKRWSLTGHALQAIRDDQTLIEEGRKYIESISEDE